MRFFEESPLSLSFLFSSATNRTSSSSSDTTVLFSTLGILAALFISGGILLFLQRRAEGIEENTAAEQTRTPAPS